MRHQLALTLAGMSGSSTWTLSCGSESKRPCSGPPLIRGRQRVGNLCCHPFDELDAGPDQVRRNSTRHELGKAHGDQQFCLRSLVPVYLNQSLEPLRICVRVEGAAVPGAVTGSSVRHFTR